jgi:sugar lactone lactonase YvrE
LSRIREKRSLMIERLPHLLLTLSLALALTACGNAPESAQEPDGEQQTQQQTQGRSGQEEEEAPPPPEPAEAPELAEDPAGTVVELGGEAEGVAADPETGLVAIATRGPEELVVAEGDGEIVSRTDLPAPARHLALTEPGGSVLVTSSKANTFLEVGLPDGGVEDEIEVGDFPHNVAAYGDRVFVINEFGSTMSVIRGGEVVETVQTPLWPGGIAVTGSGKVAVLGVRGLKVRLYDARTLETLGEAAAGAGPTHLVAGPGDRLYAADTRGGAVLVYETGTGLKQVGSIPLEGSPYGIALDPEREELWVTLTARNSVVRLALDGGSLREISRHPTVRQPNTVDVDPRTGRVYVVGREEGELQILDPAARSPQGSQSPGTTSE